MGSIEEEASNNFEGAIFSDATTWSSGGVPDGAVNINDVETSEDGTINFTGANLAGATFENVSLTNATFDGANLDGTSFEGATLTNVDLGDDADVVSSFAGTTFSNVTIEDTVVNNPLQAMSALYSEPGTADVQEALDAGFDGQLAAMALGDPYIYSMRSNVPVKLPDAEACYRLYQCDNTFINAEVSIATKEHEQRMMKFVETLGHDTKNVIADGFFFSKFFIADGKNKLMIDLQEKSFSLLEGSDCDFFYLSENNNNAGNKDWNGEAKNVVVEWLTDEGNQMKATISFFANPHIENGISLSVSSLPKKALGLCVSNYRPKLMRVPSVVTEKHAKIARQVKKSRNPFQKIAIKSNREGWIMKK